jgi:hypothetical protein
MNICSSTAVLWQNLYFTAANFIHTTCFYKSSQPENLCTLIQWKYYLRFLWYAVHLYTKLRNILHKGNLAMRLLTLNHQPLFFHQNAPNSPPHQTYKNLTHWVLLTYFIPINTIQDQSTHWSKVTAVINQIWITFSFTQNKLIVFEIQMQCFYYNKGTNQIMVIMQDFKLP